MTDYKQLTDERGKDYGPPQVNHSRTAKLITAYIHAKFGILIDLTAEDVPYLNNLQKMARDMQGTNKKDTVDDQIGYLTNLLEMRGQLDPPDSIPRNTNV
jgi:hypothetical protein